MNVQNMVLFYGAVCAAMILFNCACIFIFKRRARRTRHVSSRLTEQINAQLRELKRCGALRGGEMEHLERKLQKVKALMSFDLALEKLFAQDSEAGMEYIRAIHPVFLHLGYTYLNKDTTQGVYLLHVMSKYHVCGDASYDALVDLMMEYIKKPGIYCRSKALAVLCQTKREDRLAEALYVIDRQDAYLPEKLLVTLLLSFEGDGEKLSQLLLSRFRSLRPRTQIAIISYIQQTSDQYSELFFQWLLEEPEEELRYALLRYFGRRRYEPVREHLYALIEQQQFSHWIDASIAATALSNYPGEKTIDVLKQGLSSRNWYVRYNAAESLEKLGITYNELSDILNGRDRYAKEMVTYRTERNNLMKEALPL